MARASRRAGSTDSASLAGGLSPGQRAGTSAPVQCAALEVRTTSAGGRPLRPTSRNSVATGLLGRATGRRCALRSSCSAFPRRRG